VAAELMLKAGMTSPEAESLLRSIFVHKASAVLEEQNTLPIGPSYVQLSIVTGVHRNFVRRILMATPRVDPRRGNRGSTVRRLMRAWKTAPRYVDLEGHPETLNEVSPEPSFRSLVKESLPGAPWQRVLQELDRAGWIRFLSNHRIRLRLSRKFGD
jgi:hypothetical protein